MTWKAEKVVGLIDQLAVADYDEHSPFPGQPNGIEGLKARTAGLLAAFKPVFTLHEVVAEGDTVVVYWTNTGTHSGPFMGIPPTGRTVKISGVDIYRIRDGKMAEHWHVVGLSQADFDGVQEPRSKSKPGNNHWLIAPAVSIRARARAAAAHRGDPRARPHPVVVGRARDRSRGPLV